MNAIILRGVRNGQPVWGVLPEGSKHPVYVSNSMSEAKMFVQTYGYYVTGWINWRLEDEEF